MHVLIENGLVKKYPYSMGEFRRDHANVSFPQEISNDILADYDVYAVVSTEKPAVDHTKRVIEAAPVYASGVWQQAWVVEDLTAEEVAAATEKQWAAVRKERNARLAACDWTQLSDAPVDASVWQPYRQALRDITAQSDPFNITWPLEP